MVGVGGPDWWMLASAFCADMTTFLQIQQTQVRMIVAAPKKQEKENGLG